jgi:hypothetical protein
MSSPVPSDRHRKPNSSQFGFALSLCADIASVPELTAFPVAVAACPPVALLLAVELLNRALRGDDAMNLISDEVIDQAIEAFHVALDRHVHDFIHDREGPFAPPAPWPTFAERRCLLLNRR